MKIVVKSIQVMFKDLKAGDVYTWYGDYYMKLSKNSHIYDFNKNAVYLCNGDLVEEKDDSLVNPVNGTFEVG